MAPAPLCVAFVGHRSAGKSSTVGHLLVQRGTVEQRSLDKLSEDAQAIGKGAHKYAWVCDKLAVERRAGHSIETSFSRFGSADYDITAIDTPGTTNLLKNAISGCAQADAVVLVVSAADADVDRGLHVSDNTRQHIMMAQAFGIKKIAVAVNKMDITSPPWSQERFEDVKTKVSALLKNCGVNPKSVPFIPISAWRGENLSKEPEKLPWFQGWMAEYKSGPKTGTSLLSAIDTFGVDARPTDKPLRIPIQHVYNVDGVGMVAAGCVATGKLTADSTVTLAPTNSGAAKVDLTSIESHHRSIKVAEAGEYVGFNVKASAGEVCAGMVCGDANDDAPKECESFSAQVMVVNGQVSFRSGFSAILDCHTAHVPCTVSVDAKMDRKGNITETCPSQIRKGESGMITVLPLQPICVEENSAFPGLGRFGLRSGNKIVAFGAVKAVKRVEKNPKLPKLTTALATLTI
eukprot:m.378514 g.378514  ORF g.378514 m.378514 type:complete len:461 (-) comp20932_c0_seq1:380-1762(-)